MDLIKVKMEDVERGSLLPGWNGKTVADTLGSDGRGPVWRDTGGGRHYPGPDGLIAVYVAPARIGEFGEVESRMRHALLPGSPDEPVRALCPNARHARLTVWESGIALSAVTCERCRRLLGLMPETAPRTLVR